MSLSAVDKKQIITKFQRSSADTGSPEVQIAILSEAITRLTSHMKQNKKDFHSRRGLLQKVSQRRSLLDYVKRTDKVTYDKLLVTLELRK